MNLISLYTATATANGGRSGGTVVTDGGAINLLLGLPKELGGSDANTANPEQFFACAWAASFADALGFVARQHNRVLQEISVTAKVSLGQYEKNGFGITAEFEISLPELSAEEAEIFAAEAKQNCPYTKAFRGKEDLKINVAAS